MKAINVHEAKTHLSRLLRRVDRGDSIVISRDGKPVARLVPIESAMAIPRLGMDEGRFTVPDDFDAPLPADILAAFEQSLPKP